MPLSRQPLRRQFVLVACVFVVPLAIVLLRPGWRGVAGAALVAAALLGVLVMLAGRAGRQLDRLRDAADRIAAGDLTPPGRAPAPNREIAELQESFIAMAERLEQARRALDERLAHEARISVTLQALQRQAVRQERLAAVGALVAGVAHELNNPLQAILGTAELLERRPGLPPDLLGDLAFLRSQSARAREIIRQLARFSGRQTESTAPVDLREVVTGALRLRHTELGEARIDVAVDAARVRSVHASVAELEQVVLAFLVNAQHAIEEARASGGRILVRLFDQGPAVRLEVHDDGPGVDAQNEARLFQPFFTTKAGGRGTGLGLAVSYGIVESYGGTIGYCRNGWDGATFFFELPAAGGPGSGRPAPSGPSAAVERLL